MEMDQPRQSLLFELTGIRPGEEIELNDSRLETLIRVLPSFRDYRLALNYSLFSTGISHGRSVFSKSHSSGFVKALRLKDVEKRNNAIAEISKICAYALWRQNYDLSHTKGRVAEEQKRVIKNLSASLSDVIDSIVNVDSEIGEAISYKYVERKILNDTHFQYELSDQLSLNALFRELTEDLKVWASAVMEVADDQGGQLQNDSDQTSQDRRLQLWDRDTIFLLTNLWTRTTGEVPKLTEHPDKSGRARFSDYINFVRDVLGPLSPNPMKPTSGIKAIKSVVKEWYSPDTHFFERALLSTDQHELP